MSTKMNIIIKGQWKHPPYISMVKEDLRKKGFDIPKHSRVLGIKDININQPKPSLIYQGEDREEEK